MALDRKKGIIIVAATVAGVFILITIIVIAVATTGYFFNANYGFQPKRYDVKECATRVV